MKRAPGGLIPCWTSSALTISRCWPRTFSPSPKPACATRSAPFRTEPGAMRCGSTVLTARSICASRSPLRATKFASTSPAPHRRAHAASTSCSTTRAPTRATACAPRSRPMFPTTKVRWRRSASTRRSDQSSMWKGQRRFRRATSSASSYPSWCSAVWPRCCPIWCRRRVPRAIGACSCADVPRAGRSISCSSMPVARVRGPCAMDFLQQVFRAAFARSRSRSVRQPRPL